MKPLATTVNTPATKITGKAPVKTKDICQPYEYPIIRLETNYENVIKAVATFSPIAFYQSKL